MKEPDPAAPPVGEHRRHNVLTTAPCDWCGKASATGKLFAFFTVLDTVFVREMRHTGLFCGVACFRSFHAIDRGRVGKRDLSG